ncbi:MAG: cell envelope integrity protein TolA [Nitrospirota bacterium]
MREPSLQRTAAFSFAAHVTAFLIVFLIMRQSSHVTLPSPYTVSLVSPDVPADSAELQHEARETVREETQKKDAEKMARQKRIDDGKIVQEKIALLAAKAAAQRKVARSVELRRIIDLKATAAKKPGSGSQSTGQGRSAPSDDYYTKITREIWQQWVFPDIGRKDIEAVIAVKILKDGTAFVQRVEKSSGNALFDKSAIKALARASPLTPPPYEMEIGVRFYP